MRASDEAVSRLVRQQTDTRYRTMLGKLNALFAKISGEAKANPNSASRPYHTDTGAVQLAVLPTRPAKPMIHAAPPSLQERESVPTVDSPDLKAMIEVGGPRLRHMMDVIRRSPRMLADGRVDLAASFNALPERERRESEIVGFLSALHAQSDAQYVQWHCVSLDGTPRVWRTKPIAASMQTLDEIVGEE